ncbi:MULTISPECIES: FAD-dependent oxidoreductase [Burkholderiaceae]|uniref:2,4-dichlorophenol 6-monooxygenase n=4 Tax=Burkholderiaceae TaxID=119060 RepID=A0A1M6YFD7_9BURK|nr:MULTISPECIES: FAD-dependent monooxygenase [Burkholderiaceae]CDS91149.1 2,4-dichlorophenol 6-monooxygenase [Cupriavidus sp. TGCL-26]AAC44726.1 chlorophenol monooxygenase [Cupriavidus pinatubonensis JMP134]AAR31043.1 2,4-dichlorophenol hydroxylase [Cupriavidus pinatubonensis JMP134]CAG9187071.1 2,4-dichlorophenol 6-monooxygenase [Cupriavidus pampae]SDP37559.1 2,4-dichlorophenol 6-monooxygenase [Paraburkholderia sediminicola]
MNEKANTVETDVLVVGTGPAGAASTLLLATYGVKTLCVSKYATTSRTPRSHITNQRTMEVMRDLGIEAECEAMASPAELMGENVYCTSLVGDELGRVLTWGTHPQRRADYDLASPTHMCDLPQNLLEPILVNNAARRGADVRFHTEFISLNQDDAGVTATVHDHLLDRQYDIRAKYLIGADGANSRIVDQVGLPVEGKMGVSGSINVVFEADLTKYVGHRPSVLYWVIQPGSNVGGLGIGVIRMVRPWNKWLCIWGYDIADGTPAVDEAHARQIVHSLLGDATIPVKIESTSTWTVNDMYATRLFDKRVFCMGDAVHRHPPTNGLGSNTSIQDAFNLCWKLSHVLRGKAGPELLATYDEERAPVARQVVQRANKSLGDFPPILAALGLFDTKDPEQMQRNISRLKEQSVEAQEQRAALRAAIDNTQYVYNAHGVEMNQRYRSAAIVPDETPDPGFRRDAELYHDHSSRPGAPLPHVWLTRHGRRVSTLDLCGKGRFTLLSGITGSPWLEAASHAAESLGIGLDVHIIGPGQELEDLYGDFARVREIEESGALLVRPDNIICWRAMQWEKSASDPLRAALARALCAH